MRVFEQSPSTKKKGRRTFSVPSCFTGLTLFYLWQAESSTSHNTSLAAIRVKLLSYATN